MIQINKPKFVKTHKFFMIFVTNNVQLNYFLVCCFSTAFGHKMDFLGQFYINKIWILWIDHRNCILLSNSLGSIWKYSLHLIGKTCKAMLSYSLLKSFNIWVIIFQANWMQFDSQCVCVFFLRWRMRNFLFEIRMCSISICLSWCCFIQFMH